MDIDTLIHEACKERVRGATPPPESRQRLLARAGQPGVRRGRRRLRRQERVPRPWLMPHYFHRMPPHQLYHRCYHSIPVGISQSSFQLPILML
jgi:hypothetical protein